MSLASVLNFVFGGKITLAKKEKERERVKYEILSNKRKNKIFLNGPKFVSKARSKIFVAKKKYFCKKFG